MLASLAYTESNFDTTAVSWAGAKGLMQLDACQTARAMGVPRRQRTKPGRKHKSSREVHSTPQTGVFRYDSLTNRNGINFILASYNAGLGHVYDAMALAEKYGKNKTRMGQTTSKTIILLKSNEEYFTDPVCKNGYFRGIETFNFVRDIQSRFESYKKKIK